jgi:glutamate N-acetyltransferase/amino-acid N-acetyltransferase
MDAIKLKILPEILPIDGIRLGTVAMGDRYKARSDLALIELGEKAKTACVFTQNKFCAAPVSLAKSHIKKANPKFLVINAGNANAGTGIPGDKAVLSVCHAVANYGSCRVEQVLPFSTGIIGKLLNSELIVDSIPEAFSDLDSNKWLNAAGAILTTDTCIKARSAQVDITGGKASITGIAKGSGMIKPNMATMLAFIAIDANISQEALDQICLHASELSFNRITVDGDTSTNDALALISSGSLGNAEINVDGSDYETVFRGILLVCEELAKDIARDGEGATKFVTVNASGGHSESERKNVAFAVAESPLVKTALFAADANWGRVLAAVGRAIDIDTNIEDIGIKFGEHSIVANGLPTDYDEDKLNHLLLSRDIEINITLGKGQEKVTVWSCDFSYDYVRINAEYRS